MYIDKRKRLFPAVLLLVLALVLTFSLWFWAFCLPRKALEAEAMDSMRAAVQRSALQCYVVEGVYPPTLEYLQENYGLQLNTRDYYITYDIFASNLPPDVRVVRKATNKGAG